MANIKSQKKRILTDAKRAERNKAVRAEVKTRVKAAQAAAGTDGSTEALRLAVKRIDTAALCHQFLTEFDTGYQRVIHFAEGRLHGLCVANQCLSLYRLRGTDLATDKATGKDWSQRAGADAPDFR